MLNREFADHFASEWIAAWNAHDVESVLAHYSDDFEMASPYIAAIAGEPSGVLHGKQAVGDYWRLALTLMPDLHFELVATLLGAHSLTLYYRRASDGEARGMAAEVFFFAPDGRVEKACAHYA